MLLGRRTRGGRRTRIAAAAVLREIGQQPVHRGEARAIENEATFLTARHELRVGEFFQVKRERRRRHVEQRGNLPGRHAFGPRLYEGAKDGEPRLVCECRKGGNGLVRFHDSTIVEISNKRQNNHRSLDLPTTGRKVHSTQPVLVPAPTIAQNGMAQAPQRRLLLAPLRSYRQPFPDAVRQYNRRETSKDSETQHGNPVLDRTTKT